MASYTYPLQGIIESQTLDDIFADIRISVEKDAPLVIPPSRIQKGREEFFAELRAGEQLLHRFAGQLLHQLMPEGYETIWNVIGICEGCGRKKIQNGISSETYIGAYNELLGKNDEERTREFTPICKNHGRAVVKKSFFIYKPKGGCDILWIELRVKEPSAKITDKIFGINPERENSIPNNVGEIVQDLFGTRIVADDSLVENEDYDGLLILNDYIAGLMLHGAQTKKYIGEGKKANGYEAVHTIGRIPDNNHDSRIVEVQLRTRSMHHNAESGKSSHEERKKRIIAERSKRPRWNEVNDTVIQIVSPRYEFSLSSE